VFSEAGNPEPFHPFRAERVTASANRSLQNLTIFLFLVINYIAVTCW
jgi:hypothetical protein